MKQLTDMVGDKRYRSRKWLGFLVMSLGLFVLLIFDKDAAEWVRWGTIGYPAFCAANAALKWKGAEA